MKPSLFVLAAFLLLVLILQSACSGGASSNATIPGGTGSGSGGSGSGGTGGSGGGAGGSGGGGTGGSGGGSGGGEGGGDSTGIPQFPHVFIVLEENHSFSDVVGNTANMPYLNGLIAANSLATQYYADAHPSLPNYFMLTVGEGTSITGTQGDSWSGVVTDDNVVRALTAANKTWKSYAEALPSVGYLGGDTGAYVRRHVPVVYLSDVQQSSTQAANVVPFTQLVTDMANNNLPDYAFITPDVNDDAHNCPIGMSTCTSDQMLAAADQWLSTNIAPLLASTAFQNSLLIVVFDESEDSDTEHGGGHVPCVLVSPKVKAGYQSTTLYQHESTLRLMMESLGVTDLPGAAANAPDMTEFF
ncbi:MAG: alkaline phosphatase family protein [Candidatus Sulfotelmatobacter sp.]